MIARRGLGIRMWALVVVAAAVVGLQLAIPVSRAAAEGSQITFVTPSPLATAFGGNWSIQMETHFADQTGMPVPPDQATVDVYVSGRTEPYASRLPIQPDGSVYLSQAATAVLAPGEYQVTAQIVPVPGSYVEGSQTATPFVLTISSYAVAADIHMDDASVAAGEPVIEAELSGEFVDTTGGVPAGTWAFTVESRGTPVLQTEVAQEAGSDDALRYAITDKLDRGVDYDVSATFTPIDALAAGLEVTQPSDVTFHTPGGGLGDPIPYPLWMLILTCLVPLALAATVVVLTVRIGRSGEPLVAGEAAAPPQPEPEAPVEQWDPFATASAPEAPTQVLPPQPAPTQVLPPQYPSQVPPIPGEPTFTELISPVKQDDETGQTP